LALPLTPLLETLPNAVLGAIVVGAVAKLIRLDDLWALLRANRVQALVGVGTLAATLASAPRVERGVMVGVGLALLAHLYRELSVTTPSVREGNTLTVAPEGVLWFATIPSVERLIRAAIADEHDLDTVVLDLAGVGRMDFSAAAALRRIVEEIGDYENDVAVEIVNVRQGAARGAAAHLVD
jgi:SulP family sulfate permease